MTQRFGADGPTAGVHPNDQPSTSCSFSLAWSIEARLPRDRLRNRNYTTCALHPIVLKQTQQQPENESRMPAADCRAAGGCVKSGSSPLQQERQRSDKQYHQCICCNGARNTRGVGEHRPKAHPAHLRVEGTQHEQQNSMTRGRTLTGRRRPWSSQS